MTPARCDAGAVPPLPIPQPSPGDGVVLLRAWSVEDVAALVEAFGDPVTRAVQADADDGFTDVDGHRFLAEQERERVEGSALNVVVADATAPARVLGGASLYDVDLEDATGALGYWTAPLARGRGVATRATRVLAGWGFARLGLARIALTCAPDNAASQRVAERAGFVREGLLRAHIPFRGGRRDSVLYGLLPTDLRG